MQIVIDIPEEIIKDAKESPNYYPSYLFGTIWKSIGNGTPIPDNATNGEVMEIIFPQIGVYDEWYDEPYQKGGKE